mgnify:CR=1 FL=1
MEKENTNITQAEDVVEQAVDNNQQQQQQKQSTTKTKYGNLRKHFVDSSNIEWIAYDDKNKILYVHFHSNSTYMYEKVPKNTFERLLKAGSKGRYFAIATTLVFINKLL